MAEVPARPGPEQAAGGLPDAEIRERLERLDGLLERLEQAPGPVAEVAMEAVEALTEVYGTALARVITLVRGAPQLTAALTADELLHHLLILHGIHPQPAAERVGRALEQIRPYIHSHGGEVELTGIDQGVAWIRLSGACQSCGSSAATLEQVVTETVLTAAPELIKVEPVHAAPQDFAHLIPAESLLRKPPPLRTAGGDAR